MPGPLDGVKVIEMGQLLAGPYCGQLLADYGAEVIKLEQPIVGDPLRQWGREKAEGKSLWFPIAARNKKSVTLNLRDPEGQEIARRLIGAADMVLENFRPGTMERWGLGWDELSALNPALIMIRVSGYGQTGPYSQRPGYASVGEAMGGLRYVVGDPSNQPSRTGISIGDSLAAMFAALGALAAFHHAKQTGEGQVVDASIYESVLAIMESVIPEYALAGFIRERTGSVLPNVAPSNVYPTKDDRMVLIAANQDTLFQRLSQAMGQPELAADPRYIDHNARGDNQAELDDLIAEWTMTLTADEVYSLMLEHEVVVGHIFRAPEMLEDPHYLARESIVSVPDEQFGEFPMQNVAPKFSATPPKIRWTGPSVGQHNQEVLSDTLGFTRDQLADMESRGVI